MKIYFRLVCLIGLSLGIATSGWAASGIWGSYIQISSSADTWYDLTPPGDTRASNPADFDGLYLGSFLEGATGAQGLSITKAEALTYKNSGSDVTGAYLNYSIQPVSATHSFIEKDVGFSSNIPFNDAAGTACSNTDDQLWADSSAWGSIDLLASLSPGDYELQIYLRVASSDGNHYANNNGTNYTAKFSVYPELSCAIQRSTTPDAIDLVVNSESGVNYNVEFSADLASFAVIDTFDGDGSEALLTYSTAATQRGYYRLAVFGLPSDIVMLNIPPGSFIMGDNDIPGPLAAAHAPERTVNISTFKMSEAEITNEQYVRFLNAAIADDLIVVEEQVNGTFVVGASGQSYEGKKFIELSGTRVLKDHDGDGDIDPENPLNQCWIEYNSGSSTFSLKDPQAIDWDTYPYETGESRGDWSELATGSIPSVTEIKDWPATFIKWYGAKQFALYYGCDLPTEAEWEYAAKGGARGYEYATGDGSVDATKANYNENNAHPDTGHVVQVKSYVSNPFGLYDMSGNVWEWCQDWYDPNFYANAPDPDQDPVQNSLVIEDTEPIEGPTYTGGPGSEYNGDTKIRRGGSWNYHQTTLMSAARERDYTWRGNDHFGFRIVKR